MSFRNLFTSLFVGLRRHSPDWSGARLVALSLVLAFAVFVSGLVVRRAAALQPNAYGPEVTATVRLEAGVDGTWRLSYRFSRAVESIDLGPSINGFRARDWRVETTGLRITARHGRDILAAVRGETFRDADIKVAAKPLGAPRQYDPITPMGEGGALIYTGHFTPWRAVGEATTRMSSVFTIDPGPGRYASAFGQSAPRLENWSSPLDHPAYIYVGPAPPILSAGVLGAIDDATPQWLAAEAEVFAVEAFSNLERAFGRALPATPNFFLSYQPGGAPGRAAYTGYALPGQFRMTVEGGAWTRASEFARNIFRVGTAHEAAHLWQTAARPKSLKTPDWIHEGGANVLAAETMVRLGYWGVAEVEKDFDDAARRCAGALIGRSLATADAAGDIDAIYGCGQVLNAHAADGYTDGAAGFWRALVDQAGVEGGYDADLFYALAAKRGGVDRAGAMRRFVETNHPTVSAARDAIDALGRL